MWWIKVRNERTEQSYRAVRSRHLAVLFSPLLLFQSPVRPCTSDDAIVLPCLRCIPLHCRRRNDVDNDDYDDARAYRGVSEPIRRSYEVTGQVVIARRQVCRALVSYSRSPHSRNYFVTLSCILRRRRNTSLRECERDRRGGRERERDKRREKERSALAARKGSPCTRYPSVTFVQKPARIARRRPDRCPVDGFNPVTALPCRAFGVSASCDCFPRVLSTPRWRISAWRLVARFCSSRPAERGFDRDSNNVGFSRQSRSRWLCDDRSPPLAGNWSLLIASLISVSPI